MDGVVAPGRHQKARRHQTAFSRRYERVNLVRQTRNAQAHAKMRQFKAGLPA